MPKVETMEFLGYIEKTLGDILANVVDYTNESVSAHFKCEDYDKDECRLNYIKGNLIKYKIEQLAERICKTMIVNNGF